jgi:uncharacterized membrane protein
VVEENRQIDGTMPAALAAKVQTFASTLAPDEAAQLQWLAQQVLVQEQQGEVQGYTASHVATPASGRPTEQLKQELPESLVDKLRVFAGTLSAKERSELRSVGQAPQGEVQGYNFGPGIVRDHRGTAGGWTGTVRDHRGGPSGLAGIESTLGKVGEDIATWGPPVIVGLVVLALI